MSLAENKIGYTIETKATVPEAVQDLTKGLNSRGFGILSNIDVKKIIKEKIGEDMGSYVILDVCNPKDAKNALDAHTDVGLILPCKVVVYEDQNRKTRVSLYKPTEALKVFGYSDLNPIAEKVEKELKGALDAIAL